LILFFFLACRDGVSGTIFSLQKLSFRKGPLLDKSELQEVIDESSVDTPTLLYLASDSTWNILANEVLKLVGTMPNDSTAVLPEGNQAYANAQSYYNTTFNNVNSEAFYTAFFDGSDQIYYQSTYNFQDYYTLSKVSQCQYIIKEGWFDVFTFATNITLSLFGVFMFLVGLLYKGTKKGQGKAKRNSELRKSQKSVELVKTDGDKKTGDEKKDDDKKKSESESESESSDNDKKKKDDDKPKDDKKDDDKKNKPNEDKKKPDSESD